MIESLKKNQFLTNFTDDIKYPKKRWWHLLDNYLHFYEHMGIYGKVEDAICQKLEKRQKENIFELWIKYPQYYNIISEVQVILYDEWKSLGIHNLVSFQKMTITIIGMLLTGDLCEIDIIDHVEEKYKIRLILSKYLI